MIQYIFYPQILNPITLLSGMEDNSRIVSRLIAPNFNNSNLIFAGGRPHHISEGTTINVHC